MNLNKKPSKFWIYFPLYVLLIYIITNFLWSYLTAPKAAERAELQQVIPTPLLEEKVDISCFNSYCKNLSGIFELWPDNEIGRGFEDLDEDCLAEVCKFCAAKKSDLNEDIIFETPCLKNLFQASYKYHNLQLSEFPLIPVFYNSGVNELSNTQRIGLEANCNSYRNRDYGAIIIGRASKVGTKKSNERISELRASNIQSIIKENLGDSFKCDYIYFGSKPPQLTKEVADHINIALDAYEKVNVGDKVLSDFSLRLNQSAIIVFYPLERDVFGLEK